MNCYSILAMRYMGIDFGTKRIGIAVSDESGVMAFPHAVIFNTHNLISDILKICNNQNVFEIVVGESKNFQGQDNLVMVDINKFVNDLKQNLNVPVILHPEFLTSKQAERLGVKAERLVSKLKKQPKVNVMLDAGAATIILQSYLDIKSNK